MFQRLIKSLTIIFGMTFLVNVAVAQEGHPLKGSWIGNWFGNEDLGEFVLVVMDWNGEEVTGMINPGTDNIAIDEVDLDPSDWSVEIKAGAYTIDAKIENLELPSRSLVGTWKSRGGRGNFEIVRQ